MSRVRRILRPLPGLLLILAILLPGGLSTPSARATVAPPVLLYPANYSVTSALDGSYPPTGNPTFVWQAVPGAILYTLQICSAPDCQGAQWVINTRANQYTPAYGESATMWQDGTWYWRVKVYVQGDQSDFSSWFVFTRKWLGPNNELRPDLYQPPDDPYEQNPIQFLEPPIFSWEAVPGAAKYRFELYKQQGCQGSFWSRVVIQPYFTPWALDSYWHQDGVYWWRVTPISGVDTEGPSSLCWKFVLDYDQRPTVLAPPNNSTQIFVPEFSWTAVKGAAYYELQVDTESSFTPPIMRDWISVGTRYTPAETFANNADYFWRVRACNTAGSCGSWSPADTGHKFRMAWNLELQQLTPTYAFLAVPYPVFEWTPVAGAKTYTVEVADNIDFSPIQFTFGSIPTSRFANLSSWFYPGQSWWWRVRAADDGSNVSNPSDHWRFSWATNGGPTLIYPPYYYDPATISATSFLDVRTDPTVDAPVFMWDRLVDDNEQTPDRYTLQIDDEPLFPSPIWSTTTQNLSLAPTLENAFTLTSGIYYWRVLGSIGATPFVSQAWPFRFDPSLQMVSGTVVPYFPIDGLDSVYDTPLFNWSPRIGADHYHFQIATAPDFGDVVDEAHPIYGFYTPQQRLPAGVYYWRVRAQDAGGAYLGEWSTTRRLFITQQLRRGANVAYGGPPNRALPQPISNDAYTKIAEDPSGDAYNANPDYDLTGLYLARDDAASNYWWLLTIDLPPTNTSDMYFVFYVDIDHKVGSGGATDPKGFAITVDPLFRPERVFYAHQNGTGQIDSVVYYRNNGTGWYPAECLGSFPCNGGGWAYRRGRYLELQLPPELIEVNTEWLGTVSVEAFTIPNGGTQAYDTVPSEPAGLVSSLAHFASASDKVNLLHPWHNPLNNPVVYLSDPLLSYSKPLYRSWIKGYRIQVALDQTFQTIIREGTWYGYPSDPTDYWFIPTRWSLPNNTLDNETTLYWRIGIMHCEGTCFGPWSQPMRFTKAIPVPRSLTAERTYTLPTLHWGRVEGAGKYEVSGSNVAGDSFSISTPNDRWTPPAWLGEGAWSWQVYVRDPYGKLSEFPATGSFVRRTPQAKLLSPIDGQLVTDLPVLTWQAVVTPSVNPALYAPAYRVEVCNQPCDMYNNCPVGSVVWSKAYRVDGTTLIHNLEMESLPNNDPGEDYWWHVAAWGSLDTNLIRQGPWSACENFHKLYETVKPISAYISPVDKQARLSWEAMPRARHYELEICRDADWTLCDVRGSTIQTSYVSREMYMPGYLYWRVRWCDAQWVCSPYYEGRVGPPGLAILPLIHKNWTSP